MPSRPRPSPRRRGLASGDATAPARARPASGRNTGQVAGLALDQPARHPAPTKAPGADQATAAAPAAAAANPRANGRAPRGAPGADEGGRRASSVTVNVHGRGERRLRPTRPPRPPAPGRQAVSAARPAASSHPARSLASGGALVEALAAGNKAAGTPAASTSAGAPLGLHCLTDPEQNARLYAYESSIRQSFDGIVPVLKELASHRCEPDFVERAQHIARQRLGVEPPAHLLDDAWVTGLDMRRLFAWTVFETYRRFSDDFFAHDPLGGRDGSAFAAFLQECGFHALDITPCADGRLAHAISYVLRLPYGSVRRRSYAGALFDIEDTVEKWVETELLRFREARPNPADAPTRYLKAAIYHYSSRDPAHRGCAAHGSDDAAAARAGWERLQDLRQAIENSFCCGASVDLLLLGIDTDTDAIRVHVPDRAGNCDLEHWLEATKVHRITAELPPAQARARIAELVRAHAPGRMGGGRTALDAGPTDGPTEGMVQLIARLIEQNLAQIDYVRQYHGGHYRDTDHAERFISTGFGFEEIQLRNLTYFAYLDTVEEGAADLDVGIHIFTGLNIIHGLPVPVIVRYDYHSRVPGARARAVAHCERIAEALKARYAKLCADGLLHCLRVVRDCDQRAPIEIVGSSLDPIAVGH